MFGVILSILDGSIVEPPRIVASPRIVAPPKIVDPPRRTILLLDGDVAGSGVGVFGGIY